MAKKYLSLERLTDYDRLIKSEISSGDASTLASAKSYTDTEVAKKADKVHSHDDLYYTETEIDSKLSAVNTSISEIKNGTTPVKEAEHATNADNATSSANAEKLGGQSPDYYAKASDIPTGALADKDIISESDLDSALAEKVNAAAEGNHSHSNKGVLDGITATKVSAWDSAEGNAKAYADSAATTAANKVKDDLLNGAGQAYDTLQELGDLIDDNKDAIDALRDIASGKADADHDHVIADVTGLQDALNGKANSEHGIHVEYSTTAPVMDGTASAGSASTVARSDHKHPTDTSRASKTEFDSHTGNTTVHITADERTAWNAAKTHADSDHAPANAQANVIESINVNGSAQTITNKSVDITVPTKASDIGAATASHGHAISEITDLQTTLTNASNAILANTNSINAHTDRIVALETKVGDGFEEITLAEIQALFA